MAIQEDPPPGVPEWIVTYGDMMSLLLTFFIMLVSMSKLKDDDGKARAMLDAIRQSFGPTPGQFGTPGRSLQSASSLKELSSNGSRGDGGLEKNRRQAIGRGGAGEGVRRINHGTVITLGGPALFERFDAQLTPGLKSELDRIIPVVEPRANRIMIRGHASPEPLPREGLPAVNGLPIRDKWDLSFARANAVAEYLVSKGLPRGRIVVSAAGDSEPRNLTRNTDGQRQNRRVDVFLMDAYISPTP